MPDTETRITVVVGGTATFGLLAVAPNDGLAQPPQENIVGSHDTPRSPGSPGTGRDTNRPRGADRSGSGRWRARRCRSAGTTRPARTSSLTASRNPSVSIEVDDVDAAHKAAVAVGAKIIHELQTEPWGVRRFFFRIGPATWSTVVARVLIAVQPLWYRAPASSPTRVRSRRCRSRCPPARRGSQIAGATKLDATGPSVPVAVRTS